MGNTFPLLGEVWMPWKECSVVDERLRFVAQLLDGEAMSEVCRAFGISRKIGHKIFERYKEHGLEALTDRSRRPVRYANQLPRQIESLIVAAKRDKPHWGARKIMLPSPYGCRLGPRGYSLSRPQRVHFCYGPVTRGLPWGDLVDRLQSFSFHHLCYPNYRVLTVTPAGLSPAEHASLRWTHNRTGGFPASRSRTRLHAFACNAICSF